LLSGNGFKIKLKERPKGEKFPGHIDDITAIYQQIFLMTMSAIVCSFVSLAAVENLAIISRREL
jgi:hypothetical protein